MIRLPMKHCIYGNQGETCLLKARCAAQTSILRSTLPGISYNPGSQAKLQDMGGWAEGRFPSIDIQVPQGTLTHPQMALSCRPQHSSTSLFNRQRMKVLTSQLILLLLIAAASQRKAGIQSGQEKGSNGAEHSLLLSAAFFYKMQQYKDSKVSSVKNEQKLPLARKSWCTATHKKRKG